MSTEGLRARFVEVRATTVALAARLAPDVQLVQSMDDASPTKWHLAHTTWFFERMVLATAVPGYVPVDPGYDFLFNSYYEAVGARQPRGQRGLIARPTLEEVAVYRAEVDARLMAVLDRLDDAALATVRLGCEHEQQHQELLLTDAKHALFHDRRRPAYQAAAGAAAARARSLAFVPGPDGVVEIGHAGAGFAFDNEGPRHRVWLEPFELADRCVTNAEWQDFVDDGGYRDPAHWLSDGWSVAQRDGWTAPLYWGAPDGEPVEFTLAGTVARDPDAPVGHVSFYEADAYARWRAASHGDGARLPTEAEWEVIALDRAVHGNFLDEGRLHPTAPAPGTDQLFGDVWEWTASPYVAYPRFRPLAGALGEYNGKFMCNQLVLRGGSCLSPRSHLRATYRNFFGPATRWQMAGVRLARWR